MNTTNEALIDKLAMHLGQYTLLHGTDPKTLTDNPDILARMDVFIQEAKKKQKSKEQANISANQVIDSKLSAGGGTPQDILNPVLTQLSQLLSVGGM